VYGGGASEAGAAAPSSEAGGEGAAPSAEPLPAAAGDAFGGPSEVAAKDGEQPKAEDAPKSEEEQQKEGERLKGIYDAGKAAKGALKAVKPGYGSLLDLKDVPDGAKEAIAAAKAGDYGGAAEKGIQTGSDVVKALAPVVAKLGGATGTAVAGAAAPIAAGAAVGAKVGSYGDDASTDNSTLQRTIKALGLSNDDGSKTKVTDALRNFGDQAGQSTVNLTGSQTAGKVVGTIGKIAGAVPAAPVLVGSAAVGAGKYLYGKARNLFGLKDG